MPETNRSGSFDSKQLTMVQRLTNENEELKTLLKEILVKYRNLLEKAHNNNKELKGIISAHFSNLNNELKELSMNKKLIEFEYLKEEIGRCMRTN